MRIEQLEQILAIDRCRSITKAAQEVLISQQALSNSLKSLEDELGVTIFDRTHHGVSPTSDGQTVLELAQKALTAVDELRYYKFNHQELSGTVRLMWAPAYSALGWRLVNSMQQSHPEVTVDIMERPYDEVIQGIEDGTANIGIIPWGIFKDQTEESLTDRGLTVTKAGPRRLMAFISSKSALADSDSLSLDALEDMNVVSYSSGFWKTLQDQLHTDVGAHIVRDKEDLKRDIYRGQAVALLPDSFAQDDIYCENNLIRTLEIEGGNCFEGYDCILTPRRRSLSLLEEQVYRMLQNLLAGGHYDETTACIK